MGQHRERALVAPLLKLDDALNVLKSKLMLAHLVGDHSDEPNRFGLIRFHLENLPVDLLGRLEAAGLMMLHGYRQGFGDRHGEVE